MKGKIVRAIVEGVILGLLIGGVAAWASNVSDNQGTKRVAIAVPAGVPYNRALRDSAAVQIYAAYVSWGGPQYATGANMDQAIRAANEFVKKMSVANVQ